MTTPPWTTTVDPLGEALHLLRMSGTFYARSELTAPWGIAVPRFEDSLMLHVVTSGRCWLEIPNAESCLLQPGALALVPHGQGHRLVSDPGAATAELFDLPRVEMSERYELLRHGGGGAPTSLICAVIHFDHPAARQLVALLPRVINVEGWRTPQFEWLQSTLSFMAAEAKALRPGGETVITRLADVLVIQVIRAWIEQDPAAQAGWLGALRDPQIGRALSLIHRDPARAWTVDGLATEAAMSRSAFAARFTELVGEPAMRYVGRWRMHLATTWLKEEKQLPLAELAGRLGYESEAAFSRAFKRYVGVSPGMARKARKASEHHAARSAALRAVS